MNVMPLRDKVWAMNLTVLAVLCIRLWRGNSWITIVLAAAIILTILNGFFYWKHRQQR